MPTTYTGRFSKLLQQRRPLTVNRVQRVLDIIVPVPAVEFSRWAFQVERPRVAVAPLVQNGVFPRVPDVALPLEYSRPVISGGHSKRRPNYIGVRG